MSSSERELIRNRKTDMRRNTCRLQSSSFPFLLAEKLRTDWDAITCVLYLFLNLNAPAQSSLFGERTTPEAHHSRLKAGILSVYTEGKVKMQSFSHNFR
jgi:hypothetical protein